MSVYKKYRFSGRIASFFRATDNAWADLSVIADVTSVKPVNANNELRKLFDFGHVERRGTPRRYQYRWQPDTLFDQIRTGEEIPPLGTRPTLSLTRGGAGCPCERAGLEPVQGRDEEV